MKTNSNGAFYVYGFAQAALVAQAAGAAKSAAGVGPGLFSGGVDGPHPPYFRRSGRVAAVLSRVSQSEFCGPAGEKNLHDLAWLAPRVCRHQAVLEQVMRLGAVLPARFGTLFSSTARLEDFMRQHGAVMGRFLEDVGDQQEWAVKGFFDQARAEAQWLARRRSEEPGPSTASPGLAYLHDQNLLLQARDDLDDRLAEACGALLCELNALASKIVPRRILPRETPEATREMVLNWALLLPAAALAEFRGRVQRANTEENPAGLAFEISGPWPPYSFCPVLEDKPASGQAQMEE
ncbi:MAG: GvpL/GvpF family gas vesicle protein [Verrucomicrobiota bacterium]|jgi:hypothetical protein